MIKYGCIQLNKEININTLNNKIKDTFLGCSILTDADAHIEKYEPGNNKAYITF